MIFRLLASSMALASLSCTGLLVALISVKRVKANGVPHEIYWGRGKGHIRAFLFPDGAIEAAIRFLDNNL